MGVLFLYIFIPLVFVFVLIFCFLYVKGCKDNFNENVGLTILCIFLCCIFYSAFLEGRIKDEYIDSLSVKHEAIKYTFKGSADKMVGKGYLKANVSRGEGVVDGSYEQILDYTFLIQEDESKQEWENKTFEGEGVKHVQLTEEEKQPYIVVYKGWAEESENSNKYKRFLDENFMKEVLNSEPVYRLKEIHYNIEDKEKIDYNLN